MQGDETIQESSAPVETNVPAAEPSVSPATETQSSEATASESSSETKETLLDAVLKTVDVADEQTVGEKSEEKLTDTQPDEGDQVEDEESETETEAASQEEEVPESVPAPIKKRLRKLQKEAVKYKREIEHLKPSAEIGQQLQNYAAANNLSSEDVVFSLDLASMVSRGDYEGFYKVIAPLIRHAQEVTGVVLPTDVQQMVDQQQMTPQAAAEYAKARFERETYATRARQMEEQQQQLHVTQTRDDIQRSVSAFEQRLASQDPDYKAKAPAVRRTLQALLAEHGGRVSDSSEALKLTQRAYDEVNHMFRRTQQPVRPTAKTPGSANPQTPTARAAPKSIMEAAMQGLAKTRAV